MQLVTYEVTIRKVMRKLAMIIVVFLLTCYTSSGTGAAIIGSLLAVESWLFFKLVEVARDV